MGEHKHNQTAIDAKNGLLPPKKKGMSKREMDRLIEHEIRKRTGIYDMLSAIGTSYYH